MLGLNFNGITINELAQNLSEFHKKLDHYHLIEDCMHDIGIYGDVPDCYLKSDEYLSFATGRNGREILWLVDELGEAARYIDTGERLSEEEIEAQLL